MENGKGPDKNKNTKGNLERKPSIKMKTAPPVRQTLTSYKRMLKANPLLKYQAAGIDIDELFKSRGNSNLGIGTSLADSKTEPAFEGKLSLRETKKPEGRPLVRTQSLKLPKTNGLGMEGKKTVIISGNQPLKSHNFKRPQPVNGPSTSKSTGAVPKIQINSKHLSEHRVPPIEIKAKVNSFPKNHISRSSTTNAAQKPNNLEPKSKNPKKKEGTLRRSLSSGHIESRKGKKFDTVVAYSKAKKSQSEENLSVHPSNAAAAFSPIIEESSGNNNLVFKTPSAYERRSICNFTPRSVKRSSLFQTSTPAPIEMKRLQERLNKWLKSRGKPLASFHHLRCFGIDQEKNVKNKASSSEAVDAENKENIEQLGEKSESYESLNIVTTPESNKAKLPIQNDIPEEDLSRIAKEAMGELQKLIDEDYPRAQCLGWLELIREKYKKIDEEPEYWECRAAIEQSIGNVGNAVEFYKTAIIQGAEVTTVDKSLDQLLKKFSLLNISPGNSEQNKAHRDKERIVREARNVFKSTIIQFAIQERKLQKKNDDAGAGAQHSRKFVATPVRRSTRLSRSGFVTTPGVQLCTSLREANLNAEEMDFKKNKALF